MSHEPSRPLQKILAMPWRQMQNKFRYSWIQFPSGLHRPSVNDGELCTARCLRKRALSSWSDRLPHTGSPSLMLSLSGCSDSTRREVAVCIRVLRDLRVRQRWKCREDAKNVAVRAPVCARGYGVGRRARCRCVAERATALKFLARFNQFQPIAVNRLDTPSVGGATAMVVQHTKRQDRGTRIQHGKPHSAQSTSPILPPPPPPVAATIRAVVGRLGRRASAPPRPMAAARPPRRARPPPGRLDAAAAVCGKAAAAIGGGGGRNGTQRRRRRRNGGGRPTAAAAAAATAGDGAAARGARPRGRDPRCRRLGRRRRGRLEQRVDAHAGSVDLRHPPRQAAIERRPLADRPKVGVGDDAAAGEEGDAEGRPRPVPKRRLHARHPIVVQEVVQVVVHNRHVVNVRRDGVPRGGGEARDEALGEAVLHHVHGAVGERQGAVLVLGPLRGRQVGAPRGERAADEEDGGGDEEDRQQRQEGYVHAPLVKHPRERRQRRRGRRQQRVRAGAAPPIGCHRAATATAAEGQEGGGVPTPTATAAAATPTDAAASRFAVEQAASGGAAPHGSRHQRTGAWGLPQKGTGATRERHRPHADDPAGGHGTGTRHAAARGARTRAADAPPVSAPERHRWARLLLTGSDEGGLVNARHAQIRWVDDTKLVDWRAVRLKMWLHVDYGRYLAPKQERTLVQSRCWPGLGRYVCVGLWRSHLVPPAPVVCGRPPLGRSRLQALWNRDRPVFAQGSGAGCCLLIATTLSALYRSCTARQPVYRGVCVPFGGRGV
ncbi:hypothetical protein BU14_0285s0025 [Porphyra umbilicalis]|uniref:Uncharacterized protein n=1 Tax=Porphyra umbilicalis TaxID=2786 RepID=A0A1X6P129_PORUM|nr:hypothetical protein BU14_0285s0025 [Porphyra umbilicalis]|eukprot:OSX74537.1 hypothetical protein BU14_0285s0025 [Porphyra umbilicalis]